MSQIEPVEPIWRDLVNHGGVCSRYQHYSWMSRWWAHTANCTRVEPYIVLLKDEAGKVILLLPLVRVGFGPLQVGLFMGGKHANFNLPIWRPDHLGDSKAVVGALIAELRRIRCPLDLLVLLNQPQAWQGELNPLLALPHRPSASRAYSGALRRDFDALLKERMSGSSRKKLRQKERLLGGQGVVSSRRVRTCEEIERVLAAFFEQKRERMQELGLANVFDNPGVREFITAAASEIDPDSGDRLIELYATFVGESIVATFGGIAANGRFSGMFNSMTGGELREHSPGELLLANVVRMCCERGLDRFDLGVGDAGYKQVFCDEAETLYDSIVPITAVGHAMAPVWQWGLALKVLAKRSSTIGNGMKLLRHHLSRRGPA